MADPTQVVNTTTTIPDYARPYVEQMLGMTGAAIYDYEKNAEGKMIYRDASGAIVPAGTPGAMPTPLGLKPYEKYPGERTAVFNDLQKQAFTGAVNLGANPYSTGAATGLQGLAQKAGQTSYAPSSFDYTKVAAPTLQNYQMTGPADVAAQKLTNYQMTGPANVAAQNVNAGTINAAQMMGPGNVSGFGGGTTAASTKSFTDPGVASRYMSPYMQSVVDIQQREAQRQADIAGTQRGAQAAKTGAFGGSRQAIMDAEAARNLAQQKGDITAKGQQDAYQQAMQQFNAEQGYGLTAQQTNLQAALQSALANQQTGLSVGTQNLSAEQQARVQNEANRLQASGMNAQQALQAALANQQMGYNVGSQNLQANLGVQQLGSGQDLQAKLANQQTAYNVGTQNLQANLGVQQLGSGQSMQAQLANQAANQQMQQLAEQSKQFGAGLGLQGLQAGMQGYQNLANVGQNLYGQNISNINTQAQLGGQQQQQAQNILDQKYQDFITQKQEPFQQLAFQSNILRGVPLGQGTQTVYQAPPSTFSQVAGAGLSLAALGNLFGGPAKAKGGSIKEKKGKSAGLPALVLSKMG